jgi:hypothetical protein
MHSIEETLSQKKNEIDNIREFYESKEAAIKDQHEDRILAIQRERENMRYEVRIRRSRIEAMYEAAKLAETYSRYEKELGQARKDRDTGTELEQQPQLFEASSPTTNPTKRQQGASKPGVR